MKNYETRTIGAHSFTVQQLPARMSLKVLNRLGKSLAPALAQLGGALQGRDAQTADLSKLGTALEAVFSNLNDTDLDFLIDTLLQSAQIGTKPVLRELDTLFMGDSLGLIRLLIFAAEVNYKSFFQEFGALIKRAPQAEKTA